MDKFVPIISPEDWKTLLEQPDKQWKTGYSAKSLAYCWQQASDFPACVRKVFEDSGIPQFQSARLLMAFPEFKVPLPGGKRATQNDIFALASGNNQLISITVGGKKSESFGPLVGEWKLDRSKGREDRLRFLCALLGLDINAIDNIRYQLIHRTASAVIQAKEFGAAIALMLVHSFSQENDGFEDYCDFLNLFGAKGKLNSLSTGKSVEGTNLSFGWVKFGAASCKQQLSPLDCSKYDP